MKIFKSPQGTEMYLPPTWDIAPFPWGLSRTDPLHITPVPSCYADPQVPQFLVLAGQFLVSGGIGDASGSPISLQLR